jgi:DNA-binding transcriptional MerR regulator
MRIGEVAQQAGVNIETLRYYERRGLLPEPKRTLGGHRLYEEDAVRFVRAVKKAQSLGFSLGEIEEYMRVTRRAPGSASAIARERLAVKLAEIDDKLASLRTMRTGLVRALDETWDSLDRSTSNAAYLARGGRDPELRPGEPLHVTNGESAAGSLRATALEGVVLSWDDVLHVGPLAFDPARSRALRSAFLAGHGWGEAEAIRAELARRDELLARAARDGHPIVLWFEHDLVDQLQLLQILSQLDPGTQAELVQADDYLGSLDPNALEGLWPRRQPLAETTFELGSRCWDAVTADEIEPLLRLDTTALPHLSGALRRLLEERAPLSRTKRQLLTALVEGPRTPLQLFAANQAAEEAIFLGDTWCFLFLSELAHEGLFEPLGDGSVPAPPPRGDRGPFVSTLLQLTPAGRRLVSGP